MPEKTTTNHKEKVFQNRCQSFLLNYVDTLLAVCEIVACAHGGPCFGQTPEEGGISKGRLHSNLAHSFKAINSNVMSRIVTNLGHLTFCLYKKR